MKIKNVVIGGGPGGYACAIRLGQLGQECMVIEQKSLGGTCLNVGCIPSKALLYVSGEYDKLNKGLSAIGILSKEVKIDWQKSLLWKNKVVTKIVGGVEFLLKKNGVKILYGVAELVEKNKIKVESEIVEAENILLATGSVGVELVNIPLEKDRVLDSTGLLSLEKIPNSMVILGGGVIGVELGTVYAQLGVQVTIIEMLERILLNAEEEAVRLVQKKFSSLGGKILTSAKALSYKFSGDKIVLEYEQGGKQGSIKADILGVAVGRKPNVDKLNLEKLGIKNNRGRIVIDNNFKTNIPNIYAFGDLVDGPMLAHKATAEGVLAAEGIAGQKISRQDLRAIPDVIYSKPEIATVGISEKEAKQQGIEVKVGKFPLSALGRAATVNESVGYIKYIAQADTDFVIGATMICEKASDLISEAVLAIEMSATLEDIALTVHPHPSYSEASMEAAAAGLGKAIHVINKS